MSDVAVRCSTKAERESLDHRTAQTTAHKQRHTSCRRPMTYKPFRSTFFKRSPCNRLRTLTDAALMPAAEPSPVSWACLSSTPFQARESVALTWRPHDVPPRRLPAGLARRTLARSSRRSRFARPNPPALCPQCRLPSSLSDETSRRDEPQCACGSSRRGLVSFVTRRGARTGEHACRANVGRAPQPPKPKPPAQRRS